MRKVCLTLILFTVFLCILPLSAHALMFSDLDWTGYANDAHYKSFAGSDYGLDYDINFFALGGNLTWNANDGGVGIRDDEITGYRDALLLWFSKPVSIASFELVDLFNEGYLETGFFAFDSDFSNGINVDGYGFFHADPTQQILGEGPAFGAYSLGINAPVQGVLFTAFGTRNDYAVAGYTAAPVPEPSTVVLLGLGMIGLAGLGRRKFRKR